MKYKRPAQPVACGQHVACGEIRNESIFSTLSLSKQKQNTKAILKTYELFA
jgi:hypothetical protein